MPLNRSLPPEISAAFSLSTSTGLYSGSPDRQSVNFALVGLRRLSTEQLGPALQSTKYARLKGIVTGSPKKAKSWSEQYGLESRNIYNYENFDRMADNDQIDVIYVALPNKYHAEYAIRSAQAGKHVLCEKPMAISSHECREMIDACAANDRKLAIGYRCRFDPYHQHCIALARDQRFGPLKMIEAGFAIEVGSPNQWRLRADIAGGGAMMDVGIYALQTCRNLTGEEPDSVLAMETKTDSQKYSDVEETLAWTMKMPGGVVCHCGTSYSFDSLDGFRAYAEHGWFGLEPAYRYDNLRGNSSDGPICCEPVDQFAAEMDAFAQCILEDRESTVPGEEGLRDLLAIEAIYESLREGKEAKVKVPL